VGDFPPQWSLVRDLSEGGQGHTFVVKRSDGSDHREYVLKRLKNPKREDYFEREIQAYETLDHANVLKVLEHGKTPKGKPYLISEYCSGGSLHEHRPDFCTPLDGMKYFQQLVAGVANAHAHKPPIYHLDLKPENILIKAGAPVVGDFGICYIEDAQVSVTKEGPRGSMYYCAPEFRNPRLSDGVQPAKADLYSLGKILYWLFTGDVFDGSEEDYAVKDRLLASLFPLYPQFAFVDELISGTVQRDAAQRQWQDAIDFDRCIQEVTDRMRAGGRVLDLNLPQRCNFCAKGTYRVLAMPPPAAQRNALPDPHQLPSYAPDLYSNMRDQTNMALGMAFTGRGVGEPVPINLICDYCGNLQHFRLDHLAPAASKNWKP
jgi:serine/threonine protein kinase